MAASRARQSRRPCQGSGEPPDIAVEIVSPGQNVSSLIRKCLGYLDVGVRVVLLVDPDDETLFDFRPGQPPRALRGPDRRELVGILPGFELTAREFFDSIVPDWLRGGATPTE
jgi:Uma2 family endonuclease